MIRVFPAMFFMLLVGVLFMALVEKPKRMEDEQQGEYSSTPFPVLTLADAKDSSVTLDQKILNGKPTLINFFASWCAPCQMEMPELASMKKHHPAVQFYGIVWNDTPATIDPWLKTHGNPFDTLLFDKGGRSSIAMGLRGIPETYIIDGSGMIRYHLAGVVTPKLYEETIAPLLTQLTPTEASHAK